MSYELIAGIALFAIVAKHSERIHQATAAAIVVGLAFMLNVVTYWIRYGAEDAQAQFLNTGSILVLITQYVIAVLVFRNIKLAGDTSLVAYFAWVAIGWFIIFIATPFIAIKLFY